MTNQIKIDITEATEYLSALVKEDGELGLNKYLAEIIGNLSEFAIDHDEAYMNVAYEMLSALALTLEIDEMPSESDEIH